VVRNGNRLPLGGLPASATAGFLTMLTEFVPAGLLPQSSGGPHAGLPSGSMTGKGALRRGAAFPWLGLTAFIAAPLFAAARDRALPARHDGVGPAREPAPSRQEMAR
jgi:hypothetical protein